MEDVTAGEAVGVLEVRRRQHLLAVLTERQFVGLMKSLGRPDVLSDPRFADWPSRTANEPALREIIEEALATDDARAWETRLTAADVPCGSIWKIHEIVGHPQLEHRDVLQTVDSRYGPMQLVGAGFTLEHGSPGLDREPPTLGEHAVFGTPLLPATAFLELAAHAGALTESPTIEELTLQAPLVLGEPRLLQVALSGPDAEGRRELVVYSRPDRPEEED